MGVPGSNESEPAVQAGDAISRGHPKDQRHRGPVVRRLALSVRLSLAPPSGAPRRQSLDSMAGIGAAEQTDAGALFVILQIAAVM